jgi:hypothetical protein
MHSTIKNLSKISVLAIAATLFSYFYTFREYIYSPEFNLSLKVNLEQIRNMIGGGLDYVPDILFPLLFWFLIGIIAYFVFFTLRIVYSNLAESLYFGIFYTNKKIDMEKELNFTINRTRRLIIHASLILAYVILLAGGFLLVPVAENLRLATEKFTAIYLRGPDLYFISGLAASFVFWLIFLGIIYGLYHAVMRVAKVQKIDEEHFSENAA